MHRSRDLRLRAHMHALRTVRAMRCWACLLRRSHGSPPYAAESREHPRCPARTRAFANHRHATTPTHANKTPHSLEQTIILRGPRSPPKTRGQRKTKPHGRNSKKPHSPSYKASASRAAARSPRDAYCRARARGLRADLRHRRAHTARPLPTGRPCRRATR